jgi:hypothetical protein
MSSLDDRSDVISQVIFGIGLVTAAHDGRDVWAEVVLGRRCRLWVNWTKAQPTVFNVDAGRTKGWGEATFNAQAEDNPHLHHQPLPRLNQAK